MSEQHKTTDWRRVPGKAAARWRRRRKRGVWRLSEWAKASVTAGPNHTLLVKLT